MVQNQISGEGAVGHLRPTMKLRFVVVIVAVAVAVELAAGVKLAGENEQAEPVGRPEQFRETAEAKLLMDVTVTEKLAVPPA